MYIGLNVKYLSFLSDFNECQFFERFSKNTQVLNFIKLHPVVAELFHADGQTDMTKPIVAFSNFAKALKMQMIPARSYLVSI